MLVQSPSIAPFYIGTNNSFSLFFNVHRHLTSFGVTPIVFQRSDQLALAVLEFFKEQICLESGLSTEDLVSLFARLGVSGQLDEQRSRRISQTEVASLSSLGAGHASKRRVTSLL